MKLPRDPGLLTIDDHDLLDWPHEKMVRIHGTAGSHSLPWYQLRHFGPTPTRFDPHPPPPATHTDFAVMEAAADVETALAEVFRRGRVIEPSAPNGPYLTVWETVRALRLLDLRGTWPIRQGASHAINTGPHPVCRRWAHAIAVHPQAVDGVLYTSLMTGADATALFLPAADSFPPIQTYRCHSTTRASWALWTPRRSASITRSPDPTCGCHARMFPCPASAAKNLSGKWSCTWSGRL